MAAALCACGYGFFGDDARLALLDGLRDAFADALE